MKPGTRLEGLPLCYISQSRYRITFLQEPGEKEKLMCVIHWEDLTNPMSTVHRQ